MKGQERASRSRLLQMPSEILADIVHFLSDSKSALANLALVNSDCRQLARSSQFAEVTFDYKLRGLSAYAISTMPNLEALIWFDGFPLDRVIFGQLTHSKAKDVILSGSTMNEPPWPLEPPLTPATWPIRSLDL
ncbi:hypothetical protein CEP51_010336 [Fusarium floridanum]|uniref:F-box domain-containing protein n=1 Tax=Fusarium floridanum TaxID=1325733 RepID=A0A428RER7_9HYPO|nr:hypothetical protein CEP51_010336 [Fusarium floridanum]